MVIQANPQVLMIDACEFVSVQPDLDIEYFSRIDISKIVFYDFNEIDRLYPLVGYEDDMLYKIFTNNFIAKIYYIISDLNYSSQIEDLKKIIGENNIKTDISFILFPFSFSYNTKKIIKTVNYDYKFIALCSSPKIYRYYFLDQIYKNEDIIYSNFPARHCAIPANYDYSENISNPYEWCGNFFTYMKNHDEVISPHMSSDLNVVYQNGFHPLEHQKILNESNIEKFYEFDGIDYTIPLEYHLSAVEIVLESYVLEGIFYTEKTWKPILLEKPFITIGPKNYYKKLKKIGFILYDELFDYDFDADSSLKNRIDNITQQIINLCRDNTFYEKLDKIKDKITYNKNFYVNHIIRHRNYFYGNFEQKDFRFIENYSCPFL